MSTNPIVYQIKELDLELISPNSQTYKDPEASASKIFFLGKPGSGKTSVITSVLYEKKNIYPVAMVMSGSEDSNNHYKKIFPNTFVYSEYNPEQIKEFIKRQKLARLHLENPWAVLLLDDCTDDPKIFSSKLQNAIMKKGRHLNFLYMVALQYCLDMKSNLRGCIDGVFIFREPILANRERLWKNFASIIPDFKLFCDIMDAITTDYTALYIHNIGLQSNDWKDCVFWYKAKPVPEDFKFGCQDYWDFHYDRYNQDYVETFDEDL